MRRFLDRGESTGSVATVEPIDIDSLFPTPPDYPYADGMVDVATIPFAARTAVEFLHEERPDAVIAADRGGRLLAFATHYAWQKRYPDEHFPTRDGSIRMARLTGKELDWHDYRRLMIHTLTRAGVTDPEGNLLPDTNDQDTGDVRLTLMDDWVYRARSLGAFIEIAGELGVKASNISVVTMCNQPRDGMRHAVHPAFRVWEMSAWKDNSEAVGVHFPDHPAVPAPLRSEYSRQQRVAIIDSIDRHFERFDTALTAGNIAACSCKED